MKLQCTWKSLTGLGLLGFLAVSLSCLAQPAGGDQKGGDRVQEGGRGGRGGRRMNPEQMRKMMNDRMKERLGASEEEWKALEPLVNDVMTAQRETRGGRMMGRRRGGEENEESTFPESDALKAALEDENTDGPTIKAKLDAYRAGRDKKDVALKEAKEKLRSVLTVRQEAQLVMMGILD